MSSTTIPPVEIMIKSYDMFFNINHGVTYDLRKVEIKKSELKLRDIKNKYC
jgi:hypothetical protein